MEAAQRIDAPEPTQLGDLDPETFRRHGHAVVDWIAEYLRDPARWPVTPNIQPGDVRAALPTAPPREAESFDAVLADFERLIVPAMTHWNHPRFFGYFPSSGSAPGILADALATALNSNGMLWRTAPAATELEQLTLDWLRQLLGLPDGLHGVFTDTASVSTMTALAAARELFPELRLREEGLAGRAEVPRLRIYCSVEAHSSVDKAAIVLGLGRSGVSRVPTDAEKRMDVGALREAIRRDRAQGIQPMAVVATVATTATASVDPVAAIADVCGAEGLWLHVDAAYGGAAAILPEMRWILEGCDRADSFVVNPHKWLFVPVDCSALYTRRPDLLKRAFSVVPDYLTTPEGDQATNLMDYGISLGRRFRALKLWFVLRAFGADGIAARIREHMRLADQFGAWVAEAPDFELVSPVRFSLVLFRHLPAGAEGEEINEHNMRLKERLNATGEVFLGHTRVDGRVGLRLAVGNLHTTEADMLTTWNLVQRVARS